MEENEIKSISVVMATYNGERFIREQLDSILAQSYPITELIIQDDCSTDSTMDILQEYAREYGIIHLYQNERNLGFKDNFSSGCTKAKGEYVALSDQGDIWLPNHIEVLVNIIGDKGMACGDSLIVNSENKSLRCSLSEMNQFTQLPPRDKDFIYRIFYWTGFLQGANMLMKKSFLANALPIPDGVNFHDVWFSTLASLSCGINYSNTIITRYRRYDTNVSNLLNSSIFGELKKHSHFDFAPDRLNLLKCLRDAGVDDEILDEFELYAHRCYRIRYRFWCFAFRFIRHYREIYTSNKKINMVLRAIHFLLTPSTIHKK